MHALIRDLLWSFSLIRFHTITSNSISSSIFLDEQDYYCPI
jgi:hypothetical protein